MKKYLFVLFLIIVLLPILILTSCSKSTSSAVVIAENHVITDKAELIKVNIELRPVTSGSKEKVVIFFITLKNVTDKPLVYKAVAIIDGKHAGEGAIPDDEAGIKKAMPGQEITDRVAVMYNKIPTNFVLYIDVEG